MTRTHFLLPAPSATTLTKFNQLEDEGSKLLQNVGHNLLSHTFYKSKSLSPEQTPVLKTCMTDRERERGAKRETDRQTD